MDNRDDRREIVTENYDDRPRKKKGPAWLWLLLPLLLLALLAYYLLNNDTDDATNRSTSNNETSQQNGAETGADTSASFAQLESDYNAKFNAEARALYFNPDTTEYQDEAASMAKLEAIAAFVKDNPSAKLQANGSIFDDDQVDSNSTLAKQRAELVKQELIENGVSADKITVSTIDNYEGQDDEARAFYARSVTVTVIK